MPDYLTDRIKVESARILEEPVVDCFSPIKAEVESPHFKVFEDPLFPFETFESLTQAAQFLALPV